MLVLSHDQSPPTDYVPIPATSQLALSDSLPPVTLAPQLSRCPSFPLDPTAMSINCSMRYNNGSAASSCGRAVIASITTSVACTTSGAADMAATAFSPAVSVQASSLFCASTEDAVGLTATIGQRISCMAFAAGSDGTSALVPVARASVNTVVVPTRWPRWSDAVAVTTNAAAQPGAIFFRSLSSGVVVNATSLVLAAACSGAGAASIESADGAAPDSCGADLGSTDGPPPVAILAALTLAVVPLQLGKQGQPLPQPSRPFLATLSGSTLIALWSANAGVFTPNTTASIRPATAGAAAAAVPCNVSGASPDGRWLLLTTPPYARLCPADAAAGAAAAVCGYQVLVVTNPPEYVKAVNGNASASSDGTLSIAGASLACPPFCDSRSLPHGVFPYPLDPLRTAASFVPAQHVDTAVDLSPLSGTLPTVALLAPAAYPSGIYYSAACIGTVYAYTDPLTGACTNATDPASAACAYGTGDACVLCPSSGLCPGGYRLWSRPGWWAASEASRSVAPCADPGATQRCVGWDAAAGETACGAGFRQGSYLCGACSPGYYDPGDGMCTACPVNPTPWEKYRGLLGLVAGLAVAVALVYAALFGVVRVAGGTIAGSAKRVVTLGVWAYLAVQTLSLVARDSSSSSSSLPGPLRAMYSYVSVLALEVSRVIGAFLGVLPVAHVFRAVLVLLCSFRASRCLLPARVRTSSLPRSVRWPPRSLRGLRLCWPMR
jgi:hypothetical protein